MTTLNTEAVAVFRTSSGKESLRVIPPLTDIERWLFNVWGNHYGSQVTVYVEGMILSSTRKALRMTYAAKEERHAELDR